MLCKKTHASQKSTIDNEEILTVNGNVQIFNLQHELLFCKMQLLIVTDPECEFFDVFKQFGFLARVK